jgi:orotidine-5'-phosphate decarboxylase
MTWAQKLDSVSAARDSLVCVGLDPDPRRMPVRDVAEFNRNIVDATADLVCAYKPQMAFYEALGIDGLTALAATVEHIRTAAPDAVIVGDAKRGDIDSTAEAYARAMFDVWGFDVVTVHAYLGRESVEPFLTRPDRGVLVVCRTSNPGARELQDLRLVGPGKPQSRTPAAASEETGGLRLFEHVARLAAQWDRNGNVGLVVGATYPDELAMLRSAHPRLPILIPGVGAQGGDVEQAARAGVNHDGRGVMISASRSIIYASKDPSGYPDAARAAAQKLRDEIRAALRRVRP